MQGSRIRDSRNRSEELSALTYAMLLDELQEYDILSEPRDRTGTFRWATSYRGLDVDAGIAQSEIIIVCNERSFFDLDNRGSNAFILVAVENSPTDKLLQAANNALIIRCPKENGLLQKLQARFLYLKELSTRLNIHIASDTFEKNGIEDACLYTGATAIVTTDCSPDRTRPHEAFRSFLARRILNHERESEDASSQERIEFHGASYYVIFHSTPHSVKNALKIAAAFKNAPPTAGQEEAFLRLSHRLNASRCPAPKSFNVNDTESLLRRLATGAFVDHLAIEAFEAKAGIIKKKSTLRLIGASLGNWPHNDRAQIKHLISKSFPGVIASAQVEDFYVFLIHSHVTDAASSNGALQNGINEKIRPKYAAILFAASQVYHDLRDTRFAFRQIELINEYIPFVNASDQFLAADDIARNLYPFEDCVIFTLIDSDSIDPDFKDFCLQQTPIAKLYAEDRENGTENTRILLMYQFYAHRANIVAEKLHIHRNTVLYHIGKIQRRFGIDLEDPSVQFRIMVDSKVLFKRLAYSPEELENILDPSKRLKHQ